MCNCYQYSNKKVSRASGKKGVECLDFFLFPVKCLAKFGSATTQRSEVVLKPLLCLKMKSKQDRIPSELQLYAVTETKKKNKIPAAPAVTAAVPGGAQWKGSCSLDLHFWSNQLSAAWSRREDYDP